MRDFQREVEQPILDELREERRQAMLDTSNAELTYSAEDMVNIQNLYHHNLSNLTREVCEKYNHPRRQELLAYLGDVYRLLIVRLDHGPSKKLVSDLISVSATTPGLYVQWYTLFFDRFLNESFISSYTESYTTLDSLIQKALANYFSLPAEKHRDDIIIAKTLYNRTL